MIVSEAHRSPRRSRAVRRPSASGCRRVASHRGAAPRRPRHDRARPARRDGRRSSPSRRATPAGEAARGRGRAGEDTRRVRPRPQRRRPPRAERAGAVLERMSAAPTGGNSGRSRRERLDPARVARRARGARGRGRRTARRRVEDQGHRGARGRPREPGGDRPAGRDARPARRATSRSSPVTANATRSSPSRGSPRVRPSAPASAAAAGGRRVNATEAAEFRTLLERSARVIGARSRSCARTASARWTKRSASRRAWAEKSATRPPSPSSASWTGLEEGAQQTLEQIDHALERLEQGAYGTCERCGKPIGRGAAAGAAFGHPLHRRPAIGRPWLDARRPEPRAAATSASAPRRTRLMPVSVAERSLAAGPWQWAGLAAVVAAARPRRPVDEACRHEPACALRIVAGHRAALHPPRRELRHRLRPLHLRDGGGDRPHRARRRLDARLLRPPRRPAPRDSRRPRAADRRQRLEPRRPRPPRPRHGLHRPRLVARLQPRRQLHRDRRSDPPRRAPRRGQPPEERRGGPLDVAAR